MNTISIITDQVLPALLNFAGVDMLRSNHGPLILEVNALSSLEGIESATGKNIAAMLKS